MQNCFPVDTHDTPVSPPASHPVMAVELHKPVIRTVSAPCGSGKTYATCQHIKGNRDIANHLYVAPTQDLIDETEKELISIGIKPEVITSKNHQGEVGRSIIEYLKTCSSIGNVLLITWTAYINLKYFHHKERWTIFIDEIPQVDELYAIDIHQHREVILDHVEIVSAVNETMSKVVPNNRGRLRKRLENADDVTKSLRPLYNDLLNENKDVFVDQHSWTKILEQNAVEASEEKNRVFFMSMLNARAFQRCTLLGANFHDSMLHDWLERYYNVEFKSQDDILSNLRYLEHPPTIAGRLRINHLLKGKGHSKHLMRKKLDDTRTFNDDVDEAVLDYMDGRKFLYAANNDYTGALIDVDNAVRIPTQSHGLNIYDDETIIYFSPALNRQPKHQSMLEHLGFSRETIKNSTLHETAYQAIMRTALRNPDSDAIVECIVPEWETAKRLVEIFGGGSIKWICEDIFHDYKPLSQTERNQRSSYNKKKKSLFELNNDNNWWRGNLHHDSMLMHHIDYDFTREEIEDIKRNSNLFGAKLVHRLKDETSTSPLILMTFHNDIHAKLANDFTVVVHDPQGIIKLLTDSSKTIVEDKDELFLMNPTIFNNVDPEGFRRNANFIQSSMMILDFDGGDLSINDFENIFWNDAGKGGKRSFIICNSFSRSKEQPNRFRVFMFFKQPAKSIEEHQAVFDSIVNRLKQNGFTADSAKLDMSCRNGNQSFYVPCINRANPEYAYYKKYGMKTRDIYERHGIVPSSYAKTAVQQEPKAKVIRIDDWMDRKVSDVDKQVQQIKNDVTQLSDGRRTPFFVAGRKMLRLGLSLPEVEIHLSDLQYSIGKGNENWTREAMKSYAGKSIATHVGRPITTGNGLSAIMSRKHGG